MVTTFQHISSRLLLVLTVSVIAVYCQTSTPAQNNESLKNDALLPPMQEQFQDGDGVILPW
jgi:hypothetical protein